MALVVTKFLAILLLVALSTASARLVTLEALEEGQRPVDDRYGQAGEQELDAPSLRGPAKQISGEVQSYEEPLMSEIQARCKNYHGYLAGNIRIAGTVCPSTSRTGCARIIAGRRGLIGSMKICHPDGHTYCYKQGSGRISKDALLPLFSNKSYHIEIPVPEGIIDAYVIVEDDITFVVPDFIRQC